MNYPVSTNSMTEQASNDDAHAVVTFDTVQRGSQVFDRSWRMEMLRQHGDFTLAYSTAVQPSLSYFATPAGYIAYVRKWLYIHVLGDPVASDDDMPGLVDEFLEAYPNAGFYQISRRTAKLLQERRFYINEMGVDTVLNLPAYTFQGKSKEYLRYAGNWLQRRGYRIEEADIRNVPKSELSRLDDRWKQSKTVKSEVRFLNRPLVLDYEPDVRRFFLFDDKAKPLAFIFFDPLYKGGKVVGYTTAFKRRDTQHANGYAEPGLMREAIQTFQSEGRTTLRLGLSPMAHIENLEFRKNWFLHHSFRYAFNAWWVNRFFYNLRGHATFKQRFCGQEEKAYFASRSLSNDLRIAGMLRFAGII